MKDNQITYNILAALLSLFIPGLGQLIQGRIGPAVAFFIASCLLWFFWLGWILHVWAVLDAAFYEKDEHVS